MGIDELTVLKQPEESDILPALIAYLKNLKPDIIFTGQRSERGESSGMLPYLIAESLDYPLLPGTISAAIDSDHVIAKQALPRGQRRRLSANLPIVITVDQAAPAARQCAYGPAHRGTIVEQEMSASLDEERTRWLVQTARKKPKRIKLTQQSRNASERLQAATQIQASGQILQDLTADQAAQIIFAKLREYAVLK